MRFRTFAAVTLTMFAVPAAHALAADPPKQTATHIFDVCGLVPVAPSDAPVARAEPVPCALPVPAPACCAESWAPPSALDRMRKLAALHAETGARASYVVRLRNVAAADAARSIQKHFCDTANACTVFAEPKTNTLVASGEPAQVRRALDLAAALDVPPPQVPVSALVVTVPRAFLATAGLSTEKGELAWTLSARESHMLAGLFRAEKAEGKMEVLARPQLLLADKQTGTVQMGPPVVLAAATETKVEGTTTIAVAKPVSVPAHFALKVTPTCAPCGRSVELAVDTEFSSAAPGLSVTTGTGKALPGVVSARVRGTASLKSGESFVLMTRGDADTVSLVVLTPTAPAVSACPGWFTK